MHLLLRTLWWASSPVVEAFLKRCVLMQPLENTLLLAFDVC
jgi:hypothetical protein